MAINWAGTQQLSNGRKGGGTGIRPNKVGGRGLRLREKWRHQGIPDADWTKIFNGSYDGATSSLL